MNLKKRLELKRVSFEGFRPPHTRSEVVYAIVGNQVLFSATEDGVNKTTSTINAAEQIVSAICEAEGISWREYTFYDVQTTIGYPHHEPGYLCVDQLRLEESSEGLNVDMWIPVATSEDHARERGLNPEQVVVFPPGAIEPFRQLASGEAK